VIADANDPKFMRDWWPCRLFDATGAEIHGYVVWADTETGEVVTICPRHDGGLEMAVDDRGQRAPKKEWKTYPAPLRLRGYERSP